MLLEPNCLSFSKAILQFCKIEWHFEIQWNPWDVPTEFNSSSSGLPVLEVTCDGTQQLQMEVGSLGSMVVYGEMVDDHVIVNGRSL